MIKNYIQALEAAEESGSIAEFEFLSGFGGAKLLGALQRLTQSAPKDTVYCEIGVFQGLSLVSVAAANPDRLCFGIDNFAYLDPNGENKKIVEERVQKAGTENVRLIDRDYEDALEEMSETLGGRKIGAYFVDGPHDYRSQLMCLLLAKPFLHEEAVIIVDDSNYRHVRQANRDFLKTHPQFKLLFETYTGKHPENMNAEEEADARAGWWNGVNVLVGDPNNVLAYLEPPTLRSRDLYENDHEIHSMRHAHLAPLAMTAVSALRPLNAKKLIGSTLKLIREVGRSESESHASLNVFSEDLPRRFNPPSQ